jgi:sulfate/thiosulfate transport system permease protein
MNFRPLKKSSPLPGFWITLGWTALYLALLILLPLSTLFYKTATLSWEEFWGTLTSARTLAAFRLSFTASVIGAGINTVFGLIVAWVLVRYTFPGKKLVDGLVDLPFALPTAVAGIALTSLFAQTGWLGRWFAPLGIQTAYSEIGVIIALTFIGLPFVVRTVQPVLEDLPSDTEEAAAVLGAGRWRTFVQVILPELSPALWTGFALAFARALGEYGSVIFISGNIPGKTEIVPLLIMTKLEEFNYPGATAVAVVMLTASFTILLLINFISGKGHKRLNPR